MQGFMLGTDMDIGICGCPIPAGIGHNGLQGEFAPVIGLQGIDDESQLLVGYAREDKKRTVEVRAVIGKGKLLHGLKTGK